DRLLHDRLGRRPECSPLTADDEMLQGLVEIEVRVRDDQVINQPDGELTSGKPHRLVVVGVDYVVAAALAFYLPGLATADVVADGLLQLQRHMLGYVAHPGALREPLHEAASAAATTGVVHQARQPLEQCVGEARKLVGRKVFEHAEINNELDGGFVVPDIRTAEDPARDDLEIRVWSRGDALGHEISSRIGFLRSCHSSAGTARVDSRDLICAKRFCWAPVTEEKSRGRLTRKASPRLSRPGQA